MAKTRIPNQPNGMPQGKHLIGIKGTKDTSGQTCMCGGCHPNAQAKKGQAKIIDLR